MCVDLTLAYAIGQGCHGEPTCIVRNCTVQLVDNFRQNSQKKLRPDPDRNPRGGGQLPNPKSAILR